MRTKYFLGSILVLLGVLLAACGGQTTPTVPADIQGPVDTVVASTAVQTAAADDFNNLVAALQSADVTVESGEPVDQPFFTVPGQTLKVNGQDVQVLVYDTAQAMEAEAAQISADASTIGTSMPTWTDAPHFYKMGRMLILYILREMPEMESLYGTHKERGLTIIAINVGQEREAVETSIRNMKLTYTVALDGDGSVSRKYQVSALPRTLFLDRTGVVRYNLFGEANEELLRQLVHKLL